MGIALLSLLVVGAAMAIPPEKMDCPAVERKTDEFARNLRTETDATRRVELGYEFLRYTEETRATAPLCVSTVILPKLIDLLEDPNIVVRVVASDVLRAVGPNAITALPALRQSLPLAEADDADTIERRRLSGDPAFGVTGTDYQMAIKLAIDEIEYARDYPARWRSGMCTRLERRGGEGHEEVYLRVALRTVDAVHCTSDLMNQSPTWTYTSQELSTSNSEIPAGLFEGWARLSRFVQTGVGASQICPPSASVRGHGDLRLANMRLGWIDNYAKDRYHVEFESVDPNEQVAHEIAFSFEASQEIRAPELGRIECTQ